jgi:phosphopantetheinyl transferase (holo-ACP synthase)
VDSVPGRTADCPLARRFFLPKEIRFVQAAPEAQRTEAPLSLWTRKEALLKAMGVGLAHRAMLRAVAVLSPPTGKTAWRIPHGRFNRFDSRGWVHRRIG